MMPKDGLRRCLEQAWDTSRFVGADFAQWARTHDIPLPQMIREAEAVRLSRSSKAVPYVSSGEDGE